jgi:hypothetical protein
MKGKPGCAGRLVDEYTGVVEDIQMFSTTPVFYWSRDNGGPFIVTGPNKRMQMRAVMDCPETPRLRPAPSDPGRSAREAI